MGTTRTSGIYIAEKDNFPNSVVEVAMAVPVFVGYTEIAANGCIIRSIATQYFLLN